MLYIHDRIRTMQIIATAVARGRSRYVCGTVGMDKAAGLVAKFESKYGTNAEPSSARAQQRAGEARSTLVMLARPSALAYDWWLLVGEGSGPVVEQELLVDATKRDGRVRLDGFELVRMPAANREARARWTWRLPPQDFEELMAHAQAVASHISPGQAQALIGRMASWPGYHGLAEQRRAIWRAMVAARERARREIPLEIPRRTPWPGRLEMRGHGRPLAVATQHMRQTI